MMDHNGMDAESLRELVLHRYIQAIETGDLEAIITVLGEALTDPELDRQIAVVNEALHDEVGLDNHERDARVVRSLLLRHLPIAALPDTEDAVPTVATVAARIQGDPLLLQQLVAADRLVNRRLLDNTLAIPVPATSASIARLAEELNVTASERYWELFRRESVAAALSHSNTGLRLAAARRETARRPTGRRGHPKEKKS